MIVRKQVGLVSDVQILSSNVDTMLIATSVNSDLNHRRLERYLAVAWESGVVPVILLTKSDVSETAIESVIEAVRRDFPGVDVHAVSREGFAAADFFRDYLRPGTTTVVVGSSGVGKSTLVNFLIAREDDAGHDPSVGPIKTQEIRDDDERGRHTTTARSLYQSRYGGLVIDTPGMRELHLSDHTEGVSLQFADIEALVSRCRFSDCRHDSEPSCAVKAAIESGELTGERWGSYQKLAAEARFEARKHDKALASREKQAWKKLTAQVKRNRRDR